MEEVEMESVDLEALLWFLNDSPDLTFKNTINEQKEQFIPKVHQRKIDSLKEEIQIKDEIIISLLQIINKNKHILLHASTSTA